MSKSPVVEQLKIMSSGDELLRRDLEALRQEVGVLWFFLVSFMASLCCLLVR